MYNYIRIFHISSVYFIIQFFLKPLFILKDTNYNILLFLNFTFKLILKCGMIFILLLPIHLMIYHDNLLIKWLWKPPVANFRTQNMEIFPWRYSHGDIPMEIFPWRYSHGDSLANLVRVSDLVSQCNWQDFLGHWNRYGCAQNAWQIWMCIVWLWFDPTTELPR